MGAYAKMAQKFAKNYDDIEDSVLLIKDTVKDLDDKIHSIDFFDFKAIERLGELKQLQKEVEKLRNEVDAINEEIDQMEKDDTHPLVESEESIFNDLNKKAGQINKMIKITDKKLTEIQDFLTTNNLWATFSDMISDLQKVTKKIAINVIKVSIKATKEVGKLLPEQVQEAGRVLLSSVVSKLLEGR